MTKNEWEKTATETLAAGALGIIEFAAALVLLVSILMLIGLVIAGVWFLLL